MITLEDIADKTTTSVSVVSDVLRGKGSEKRISQTTQNRILETARELNYRSNQVARSLVIKRTKTIGVLVPDMETQFLPEVVGDIENTARERGYHVILCLTEDKFEEEKACIDTLVERMVDGIIISHAENGDSNIKYLMELKERRKIPVVFVNRSPAETEEDFVIVDNMLGAYEAVNYLIKLGHKNIAYLSGPTRISTLQKRFTGYKKALEEHGLKYDERLIMELPDVKMESGYQSVKQLLEEGHTFTALFTVNDVVAIGASKAIRDAGLRIPEDVSIVGFDDIKIVSFLEVPLTTVNQQQHTMGSDAANILIDRIEKKITDEPQQVILKPQLVIRKSCAALKYNTM